MNIEGDCTTLAVMKVGNSFYIRVPMSFIKLWKIKKGTKVFTIDKGESFEVIQMAELNRRMSR